MTSSRPVAALLLLGLALAGCSAAPSGSGTAPAASGGAASGSASASQAPAAAPSTVAPGAFATPSTGGVRYSPTGSGKLDGKTIVLDPGHNGAPWIQSVNNVRKPMFGTQGGRCQAVGATAADKSPESAMTWALAQKVLPGLLAQGATVILTRPNNEGTGPCNDERATMANNANADFLLSIHGDGAETQKARGFYTLVPGHSAGGQALIDADKAAAAKMVAALQAHTQIPPSNYVAKETGWIRSEDVAVLNNLTKTRGVLVEVGNIFQNEDWAVISSDSGKQGLADGMVAGVVDVVTG